MRAARAEISRPRQAVPSNRTPTAQIGTKFSNTLFAARVSDVWAFIKRQPLSFWAINSYLFFEYVRPQQVFEAIDVLPFAWTSIIVALIALLGEGGRMRKWYAADTWLLAFSCLILVASMFAEDPSISFSKLGDYFAWVLIYFLITNIITNEQRFFVFVLAFLIYSTKMSQHGFRSFAERGGGFASWGATGAPGWFQNSGEFGIQMCVFVAMSTAFILALRSNWPKWKRAVFWFMPVSALISIVASSSRGAVLGLGVMLIWLCLMSPKRVKALASVAVVAGLIWVLLPAQQKDRFRTMGEDDTSQTRLIYWKRGLDVMHNYPVLGVGYKNWMSYTGKHYPMLIGNGGERFNQLPHNIFIEAGAELGYTGLLMFIGLIGATLYTNHRTRKRAKQLGDDGKFATAMARGLDAGMIGYLGAGFFVTVFYYPFFWINYAITVALHHSIMIKNTNPVAKVVPTIRVGGRNASHANT
jgi:O-antigen ligase